MIFFGDFSAIPQHRGGNFMSEISSADTFTVIIEKLLNGGDGLARHDGKTVFVPCSVPGDELLVRPVTEKKNFTRAEIVRVLSPGGGRIAPACPHFGKCGGCDWQQLEYSRQTETKRLILEELFHHHFPEIRQLPITMRPSPHSFGYRSRARVRIQHHGDRISVGFFRGSSHIIHDMESCPLFRQRLNETLQKLRQAALNSNSKAGMREIDIACSDEEGMWSCEKSVRATSLRKQVGDFTYAFSPETFFQANDFMVGALVEEVMDRVSPDGSRRLEETGSGTALDLYSGVGLFSLPLSQRFRTVTAVESSRASSRFCASNAAAARCANISNVCADVAVWLESPSARSFDCIVLDPPRAGVASGVMEKLIRLAPGTIIYVSCDPQTLVRDLGRMNPSYYRIESITGLDMFPQTCHFETVVKLVVDHRHTLRKTDS